MSKALAISVQSCRYLSPFHSESLLSTMNNLPPSGLCGSAASVVDSSFLAGDFSCSSPSSSRFSGSCGIGGRKLRQFFRSAARKIAEMKESRKEEGRIKKEDAR